MCGSQSNNGGQSGGNGGTNLAHNCANAFQDHTSSDHSAGSTETQNGYDSVAACESGRQDPNNNDGGWFPDTSCEVSSGIFLLGGVATMAAGGFSFGLVPVTLGYTIPLSTLVTYQGALVTVGSIVAYSGCDGRW